MLEQVRSRGRPRVGMAPFKRLLIGVMSVARDDDRRAAMRETWVREARAVAPSVSVRFVIGRPAEAAEARAIARENATSGDVVALACAENQHEGKTLAWFAHATARPRDGAAHDYVAKMDQDAYVWPLELHAHVQGFAAARFYGGATWRHPAGNRRRPGRAFEHVNGGFAVVSAELARALARAAREQPRLADGSGWLDRSQPPHGRWLARANEDVAVALLLHAQSDASGSELEPNDGDFPWSRASPQPAGDRQEHGLCPWRHAADLKEPANYREQWERRGERICRCNACPWRMTRVGEAAARAKRPAKKPR